MLMKRCFGLITAGLTIGLPLLFLAVPVPVHATPASTFAELNFRNPAAYFQVTGTDTASLSHTREGSTARFTADATAGTVSGFAHSADREIGNILGLDSVWARGFVDDTFTLNGPAPGTPVSVTAYFTLDGTLSGGSSLPYTAAAFNNAYVATQFTALTGNDLFAQWARTDEEMSDCWLSGCSGFSIDVHRVASLTLDIIAGDPFGIYYSLFAHGGWAYGGSGGTSDFGSTGAISFVLPVGTSITSSGGFSQTNTNPIPAPSSLLLLGSGLAGVALLRKRFKARG